MKESMNYPRSHSCKVAAPKLSPEPGSFLPHSLPPTKLPLSSYLTLTPKPVRQCPSGACANVCHPQRQGLWHLTFLFPGHHDLTWQTLLQAQHSFCLQPIHYSAPNSQDQWIWLLLTHYYFLSTLLSQSLDILPQFYPVQERGRGKNPQNFAWIYNILWFYLSILLFLSFSYNG